MVTINISKHISLVDGFDRFHFFCFTMHTYKYVHVLMLTQHKLHMSCSGAWFSVFKAFTLVVVCTDIAHEQRQCSNQIRFSLWLDFICVFYLGGYCYWKYTAKITKRETILRSVQAFKSIDFITFWLNLFRFKNIFMISRKWKKPNTWNWMQWKCFKANAVRYIFTEWYDGGAALSLNCWFKKW